MDRKHLPAVLFIMLFSLFVIWIVSGGRSGSKTVSGFPLPAINIATAAGKEQIRTDRVRPVIIMCFSSSCEHCAYELNIIDKSPGMFSGTRLYLVTSENNYLANGKYNKWKTILADTNIKFCIADKKEFESKIESVRTPSFYFFTKDGYLTDKIYGEAKKDRIWKGIENARRRAEKR